MAIDRLDDAVPGLFSFLNKRAKQSVPNDQRTSVVFVQILIVNAVVNTVMRWRVKDRFQPAEATDKFGMNPELVNEIKTVHQCKHPRREPQQHDRGVKDPMRDPREPTLASGNTQIEMLTRMMNNVKIPKEP